MYVQKGTQRIEVIVRGEGVGGGEQGTDGISNRGKAGQKQWADKRAKRVLRLNTHHALITTIAESKRFWHFKMGGLGYQYGDQAYQEQIERQTELIEDFVNPTINVASGIYLGSFGGPIGMIAGALIGVTKSVLDWGFKYSTREREYNYKVMKQENAIEYKRARAGTNLTFGRLR